MLKTILIFGPQLLLPEEHQRGFTLRVEVFVDWCFAGWLNCRPNDNNSFEVWAAYVCPVFWRQRCGHAMMYELEKRFPGVTTSEPDGNGRHSIPSWFALRDEIMRTGNPHLGRNDLGTYVSDVYE